MKKFSLSLLYIFTALIIFYVYFFFIQEKFIGKKTAIEKAQLYCGQLHSEQEKPHSFESKLIKCSEVGKQTGWAACNASEHPSDLMVWYVSMEGLWFHYGPAPQDEANIPILFKECSVIMDAKTGDLFELGSQ